MKFLYPIFFLVVLAGPLAAAESENGSSADILVSPKGCGDCK